MKELTGAGVAAAGAGRGLGTGFAKKGKRDRV